MNFTQRYYFTLFCCEAVFVANLRTFLVYNFKRPQNALVYKKGQKWGMLTWYDAINRKTDMIVKKSSHTLILMNFLFVSSVGETSKATDRISSFLKRCSLLKARHCYLTWLNQRLWEEKTCKALKTRKSGTVCKNKTLDKYSLIWWNNSLMHRNVLRQW